MRPIFLYSSLFLFLTLSLLLCSCGSKKIAAKQPPSDIEAFSGSHTTTTLKNSDDLTIFNQYWTPPGEIKGIVFIIHGTTLHGGLYIDTAKYLSENGYLVYATDLQGWGQSEGKGRKGYVDTYDSYVKDVKQIVTGLKITYPGKKCFVIGESIGALVPVYGHLKNELDFDGYILSAMAYNPNPKVLGIRLPEFMAGAGRFCASSFGKVAPKLPALPAKTGLRMTIIDKETQKALLMDPYVTTSLIPAKYFRTILDASKFVGKEMNRFDAPVLLLHGTMDILVPVKSSETFIKTIASPDRELIVLDTGHSTLLEPSKYELMAKIRYWMDERL